MGGRICRASLCTAACTGSEPGQIMREVCRCLTCCPLKQLLTPSHTASPTPSLLQLLPWRGCGARGAAQEEALAGHLVSGATRCRPESRAGRRQQQSAAASANGGGRRFPAVGRTLQRVRHQRAVPPSKRLQAAALSNLTKTQTCLSATQWSQHPFQMRHSLIA